MRCEVHQVHQVGDAAATRIQANVRPDAEGRVFLLGIPGNAQEKARGFDPLVI